MSQRFKATLLLLLVSTVQLLAIPARKGVYTYTQPDGSSFKVQIDGDEFFKRVTTVDGCSVILDKDGYYCYAYYDFRGIKHSTGVRVTATSGGTSAAAAARNIPYATLRARSADMRASAARLRARRRDATAAPATRAGASSRKVLVIPAQFQDLKFTYGRSYFVDMLTGSGYTYNGATGSALKYFNDQFEGKFDYDFVVSPVVTLSKGYAYYGANSDEDGYDERAAEAVAEACRLVDSSINFAEFDPDGDGEVDDVFVFVAGMDEAEGAGEDHIWSHQWALEEAGIRLSLDGKRINTYAISTEITHDEVSWTPIFATIGTFCHEFSHCLGLNDLYDTDDEDSGGVSDAVWGTTSLMDHGNYNNSGNTPPNYNSIELETLGIGKAEALEIGEHVLPPLSGEKRYLKAGTDVDGEYFLFECRAASGWDKYIGGSGLLIYHVDKSDNPAGYSTALETAVNASRRWAVNEVNCNPDHQCAYIVPAQPSAKDVFGVFWPNGRQNSFSPDTDPAYRYWSGGFPTISLADITYGSEGVRFNAVGPLAIEKVEEFQDAAIVLWTATQSDESVIGITGPDGKTKEYTVRPYADGCFSYVFEGLQPKTNYKVYVSTRDSGSKKVGTEFTTKGYYSDGYPFIYLNSADRNTDGTFKAGSRMPLRVFNARGAVKVEWKYDARALEGDGSGYYTVRSGCTLSAIVYYEDGSHDIISKTITVK